MVFTKNKIKKVQKNNLLDYAYLINENKILHIFSQLYE